MTASGTMAWIPASQPAWKLLTQKVVFGSAGTCRSAIFATARAAACSAFDTLPKSL